MGRPPHLWVFVSLAVAFALAAGCTTASQTATGVRTATPMPTYTPVPTYTPLPPLPTYTLPPSPTATRTYTESGSPTLSFSVTPTATLTPSASFTPSGTSTATVMPNLSNPTYNFLTLATPFTPTGKVLWGDTLTYTIYYGNDGTAAATNATIGVSLDTTKVDPATLVFLGGGGSPFYSSGTISWNFISIPAGTQGSVAFQIKVKETCPLGAVSSTSAILDSDQTAPFTTNTVTATVPQWTQVTSPSSDGHAEIEMLSSTEGWILTYNTGSQTAGLLKWNGANWSVWTPPNTTYVRSFSISGQSGVGYAVGPSGAGWKYLSGSWYATPMPNTTPLVRVHLSGPTTGWAVGPEFAQLSGSQWTIVPTPASTPYGPGFVHALNSAEAWVSSGPGGGSRTLRYVSGSWSDVPIPIGVGGDMYGMDFVSSSAGWLSGYLCAFFCNVIFRWDGTAWNTEYYLYGSQPTVGALSMVSATEGWSIGSRFLHYSNGAWHDVGVNTICFARDVAMLSRYEGWAVGTSGSGAICRFD